MLLDDASFNGLTFDNYLITADSSADLIDDIDYSEEELI